MTILDTGIMAGAVLKSHREHEVCLAGLVVTSRLFTNAHALAVTFTALTGFYQVPTEAARAFSDSPRARKTRVRRVSAKAAGRIVVCPVVAGLFMIEPSV